MRTTGKQACTASNYSAIRVRAAKRAGASLRRAAPSRPGGKAIRRSTTLSMAA
jgi:hypothetical protein